MEQQADVEYKTGEGWLVKTLHQWQHKQLLSMDDSRLLLAIADLVVRANVSAVQSKLEFYEGEPTKCALCALCSYPLDRHGPIKLATATVDCPIGRACA